MKFKSLFFTLIISIMFIFAGCSSDVDCSSQDTDYIKYTYDKESKLCVVSEQKQKDVCGNGIIEDGETYCSCAKDVQKSHPTLGCQGTLGTYLEKSCNIDEQCVLTQNSKVVEQIKSLEFKNSDVIISGRFKLNTPFIQNSEDSNVVEVSLELFKFPSTSSKISSVVVNEITMENSGGLLYASQDLNKPLSAVGSSIDKIYLDLADISKYQSKESLKIKVIISYTKDYLDSKGQITKSEDKKETLVASLGTWEIINPNFFIN